MSRSTRWIGESLPNAAWLEHIPQLDVITESTINLADGYAVPSTEPGNGIAWNWKSIERMQRGHAVIKS